MKLNWLSFFACLALAGSACTKSEPKPAEPAKAPAPAPKVEKPVEAAAAENPACFGVSTGGKAREFTIGTRVFKGDGYAMVAATTDAATSGQLKVGVISDIKEFLPETITNLKTFAAWIKAASADLVVVNGDVAYSQNEMESVLRVLGTELTTPILVTSGNKELSRDFDLALTNVAADHPQIINGNRVRSLTVNDITFVTLPGYGRKNYTEPGACLFGQPEIDATGELLKKAVGTRVLVAHASPLQAGAEGIDYMVDGKNVGDPRLAAMLTATGTKFAIVGNIKEAGGRGATVAGKALKAGEMSGELVLNPGPADATPWSMVDKSVSHGMAGLVTFAGGKASYEIKRVEAPKK
jgi:Icc-related predicted phosphoesterase